MIELRRGFHWLTGFPPRITQSDQLLLLGSAVTRYVTLLTLAVSCATVRLLPHYTLFTRSAEKYCYSRLCVTFTTLHSPPPPGQDNVSSYVVQPLGITVYSTLIPTQTAKQADLNCVLYNYYYHNVKH